MGRRLPRSRRRADTASVRRGELRRVGERLAGRRHQTPPSAGRGACRRRRSTSTGGTVGPPQPPRPPPARASARRSPGRGGSPPASHERSSRSWRRASCCVSSRLTGPTSASARGSGGPSREGARRPRRAPGSEPGRSFSADEPAGRMPHQNGAEISAQRGRRSPPPRGPTSLAALQGSPRAQRKISADAVTSAAPKNRSRRRRRGTRPGPWALPGASRAGGFVR